MNLVQICMYKYPGQVEAGNITFYQPESDILIHLWTVPNESRPLESDLWLYGEEHERAIEVNAFSIDFGARIKVLIDATARAKSYYSGAACASYAASTNQQWQSEAEAFIAWRDSVFEYAYEQSVIYLNNSDPLPTLDEFMASLPEIVWPA